jgi:radical SAM superfamily enzyme YgiQ (UPF0313 family)
MTSLKIAISYPPLDSSKGSPFLSQNRQFQWTNTGNVIYPVIPAYAASLLQSQGHQILWDDAIAQKISYTQWLKRLLQFKPNLVIIESKTPVIKKHWQIIKDLKAHLPQTKVVLMGDHVTALPEESFHFSPVDYVLTGGDYDFMLDSLVRHLTENLPLEPGFWYRRGEKLDNSDRFALKHHHLDDLPFIDRDLTQWELYAYHNTNYKYTPGTYTMFGRDCWWGKCTFCSWTTTHPFGSFRCFSVKRALDEVGHVISHYPVKEIFDDTGTFPVGKWLVDFCQGMIERGYHRQIKFGCNMRFAALDENQYQLMGQAGFRFILYGLESSNQQTLNRIAKNTQVADARQTLTLAKKAHLEPHLTIMIGYPWETKKQAQKTLTEARSLFQDGLANTMQATRIIPYPGTPLFTQCQKNNWLLSTDWDDYDMRQPIMKSPLNHQQQEELIQSLFQGILSPRFILRQILSIRSITDILHLVRYAFKYLKKLRDFPTPKAFNTSP